VKFKSSIESQAPEHLKDALGQALDSSCLDDYPWWQVLYMTFLDPSAQQDWDDADERARAGWLLGELSACSDIAAEDVCEMAGVPRGSSYAVLAQTLRAELNEAHETNVSGPVDREK
jgi:hypothetical protein